VEFLTDFIHRLRDLPALVQWAGYVGLTLIIFAETGLLVGFFLPGDSLLVTAGLLCSQPGFGLNVYLLGVILTAAAIVGDTVGYAIGRSTGPRIFTRPDSLLFNRKHLQRAHDFYERHGGKTIIIARFMPIARTFAPFVAGVARMTYARFLPLDVLGGAIWIFSLTLAGYWFGNLAWVKSNLSLVIVGIIALSLMPLTVAYLKSRLGARASA
jgi:membrane-associated protein